MDSASSPSVLACTLLPSTPNRADAFVSTVHSSCVQVLQTWLTESLFNADVLMKSI